jgi:hypothetical protein
MLPRASDLDGFFYSDLDKGTWNVACLYTAGSTKTAVSNWQSIILKWMLKNMLKYGLDASGSE